MWKDALAGEIEHDGHCVKAADFYEKYGTRLMLGRRVERIDRAAHTVVLEDGSSLAYGTLVIATGSRPRALDLPGAFYLRNIADVAAIRARFAPGRSLVVCGGGC